MSRLADDDAGMVAQAFRMSISGETITIGTLVGVAVSSASLAPGMYRIIADADVTLALDITAGGDEATANDMPFRANSPEYFKMAKEGTISAFDSVGSNTVALTLMP